ncbi:hypothetical protein H5V45_06790 [Nocardioides sp. KIGAM211]|uniref:CBU-0592-like domain-containing protein n=1 Tax=Nocardioides luti TaxID=2761101 RepID=A0A7X0V9Z0_9ACTN|nr:hypothetical protein [Nocardioides luti]MBB6627026.1 hypothetical protein [Nocardioides luti]
MDLTVLLVNVLGWVGMALLIGAYALVTAGRVHASGLPFQLMNLFGGGFLMVNSAYYGAWPSAVLNLVWVGIGSVGLLRARGRSGVSGGPATVPGEETVADAPLGRGAAGEQ